MSSLKLLAYAKVNLYLAVISKRQDGYHDIKTILQNISIFDELEFIKSDYLQVVSNFAIDSKDNLVTRAAVKMLSLSKEKGVKINLKKNIPVAAGLGGGSADAAATLIGLNKLWSLSLSGKALLEHAIGLGADVPFFLKGGTIVAEGIGETIKTIPNKSNLFFVIAKPTFGIMSHETYHRFDKNPQTNIPPINPLLKGLEAGNIQEIAENCSNMLEPEVEKNYKQITEIKEKALASGALNAVLSGSGPSVYCIAKDKLSAENIASSLQGYAENIFVAESRSFSIEEL